MIWKVRWTRRAAKERDRLGKWRVLFLPERQTEILWVLHVLPRDKAYGVREPVGAFSRKQGQEDGEILTPEERAHSEQYETSSVVAVGN